MADTYADAYATLQVAQKAALQKAADAYKVFTAALADADESLVENGPPSPAKNVLSQLRNALVSYGVNLNTTLGQYSPPAPPPGL